MRQISGYVLNKETNSGVPNLVVTVYDSEKSIQDIITKHQQENNFSSGDFGKRVGSVLTDRDGKFLFASEDLDYPGNDSRIDLLIIVFAPEDVLDVEKPYPLPAEKRILYISTMPRNDSGAVETFAIRLLQTQLDKFQIYNNIPSKENSQTDSQRFVNMVQSTWDFQDSVRGKLRGRLQEEQAKSDQFAAIAKENVQNLSAIPLYLRENNLRNTNYLIISRQNLLENLKRKQDEAIADGLQRMSDQSPTVHLRLTNADLHELGLKQNGTRAVGKADPAQLEEKVASLSLGPDLVRLRERNNPSPDELERKYLSNAPSTDVNQPIS